MTLCCIMLMAEVLGKCSIKELLMLEVVSDHNPLPILIFALLLSMSNFEFCQYLFGDMTDLACVFHRNPHPNNCAFWLFYRWPWPEEVQVEYVQVFFKRPKWLSISVYWWLSNLYPLSSLYLKIFLPDTCTKYQVKKKINFK